MNVEGKSLVSSQASTKVLQHSENEGSPVEVLTSCFEQIMIKTVLQSTGMHFLQIKQLALSCFP